MTCRIMRLYPEARPYIVLGKFWCDLKPISSNRERWIIDVVDALCAI